MRLSRVVPSGAQTDRRSGCTVRNVHRQALAATVCGVLLGVAPGCSLLFVKGPPGDYRPQPAPSAPVDCTESSAGPILDGVMTALGVLVLIAGAGMSAESCTPQDMFCTKQAGPPTIGVGAVTAALWGASALAGASRVADCRAAKECERGDEAACQRFAPEPVPSVGLRLSAADLPLQSCIETSDCSEGAICFDAFCRSR